MTKLLCSLWLLLSCLSLQAGPAMPVPGSFVPAWLAETDSGRNIDYDVQNEPAKSKHDYDAALMLSTGEKKLGSLATRPLIGNFVKLVAAEGTAGIKYIGKLEDLQGIPRSQTLLDQLPDLGSARANYYQNSSVLRGAIRDGYEIRDASAFRLNSSPDPTLLRPDRTVGQSFLGAERNILDNKGLILSPNGAYIPR